MISPILCSCLCVKLMFKRSCGFDSPLSANWLSAEGALPAGSHAQPNVGKLKDQ